LISTGDILYQTWQDIEEGIKLTTWPSRI
jgi:hypothetical protein